MGFWNDVGLFFGFEPSYTVGVQEKDHFYCVDAAGDFYRQLNPLDGSVLDSRPWVRVDADDMPTEARSALRVLSCKYV